MTKIIIHEVIDKCDESNLQ